MLGKLVRGFAVFIVILVAVVWLWWPENLVVKGPMLDFITGAQVEPQEGKALQQKLIVPEGFQINLYARGVKNARMMRFTSTGDMIVSGMRSGEIYLLHKDSDGDGKSDGRTILATDLDTPHGIDLKDGYLYIAETGQVLRAPFDAANRSLGDLETVYQGLPPGGGHRSRTLGFGPDGMMYVSVGSSCNVCIEEHPHRATILQMAPDGSGVRVYARGLRNSVGFAWNAVGEMFATDNGRDLLGDDRPNCELNIVVDGGHYGWPYANDNRDPDPDYGPDNMDIVQASEPMVHGFGGHRAPLGLTFLNADVSPAGYGDTALVALHGSWNRSTLAGYRVVQVTINDDGTATETNFLTGFEVDGHVVGRPVDVAQDADGTIYVSDDYAGAIYRITYSENGAETSDEISTPVAIANEPLTISTADMEAGLAVFNDNGCAACHVDGAAEGVDVKPLKELYKRYDIAGMLQLFAVPPGVMPKPELTEDEADVLARYLLSLP